MLNETQISEVVSDISAKLKAVKSGDVYKADWGELYKKACKHADEIEVHACGKFPEKLIGKNFPGETDEERNYRKESFQPTTKPYWEKAENKLSRIWAQQNYSLNFNDDNLKKYFTEELPLYKSILSYFESIATSYKIADPNALLVVDFNLPLKETEEGQLVIDDSKELKPFPSIYDSDDVLMYEEGDFALVKSEELTLVEFGNGKVKQGHVFYLYDDKSIYRIYQVGKKVEYNFEIDEYYPHNLGYLPAWKLKGKPVDVINNALLYESYFSPALHHLNEALIIHSTNRCVRNKVSYPTRVYYEQPCGNPECNNGIIYTGDGPDLKKTTCGACGGTGRTKFSPLRDFVHEKPTTTNNAGVDQIPFPGLDYVAPDGAIIKENEEVIDKYLELAFSFIHAGTRKSKTGTSQDVTGIEVKVDREDEFVAILKISNELFQLLKDFLNAAAQIRIPTEKPSIEIDPPKNFDLTSAEELAAELESARKSQMPTVVIAELYVEYVQKKFPLNSNITRMAEIAQGCDSLFTLDTSTIQILQTSNNVEKWQVILHTNFDVFIHALLKADAKLFEKTNDEIGEAVKAMAETKAAELDKGKNSAQNIIKDLAAPTV